MTSGRWRGREGGGGEEGGVVSSPFVGAGGIILMANDEGEVSEVVYSWNEGLTWETLKFTDTPVLVDNIMIEPRGAGERFVLYGTRPDATVGHTLDESSKPVFDAATRVGVVFTLDFGELHARQCAGEDSAGTDESDFERWSPSQTRHGDGCLMGRKVEYTRRKRDRTCYNPDNIEIQHFVAHCACTDMDWECDRGYRREHLDGGACVRDPTVPIDLDHLVPHYCRPGLHYHVSNGYRKVAGDSCVGGVQHDMTIQPCPGSKWHHTVSHGGWTVMMVMITLCIALAALTYCQLGGKGLGIATGKGLPATGKPASSRALPSWLPAWIAHPVAVVVGTAVGAVVFLASIVLGAVRSAAGVAGGLVAGGGSNKRNLAEGLKPGAMSSGSGSGYSSRGLGIPPVRGGTTYSGVSYGQLGKADGVLQTALDGDDDDGFVADASSGTGSRHRDGVTADADFGVLADGDDDGANLLHSRGPAHGVAGAGNGAEEADLLGLGLGGGTAGRTTGASAAAGGGPIPVLRPPRAHEDVAASKRA